jgi:hypothetical protein
MTSSTYPASSASDGRHRIWFVPYKAATNPLSVAVLTANTTKDVTYSFTPAGFKHDVSQATIADKRYTAPQDLSKGGKTSETLELQYVDSLDAGSAAQTFTIGLAGWFVRRKYIDNATDPAADQVVDVITAQAGVPRPDAPSENGIDTTTQGMYITSPTVYKQKLVA